ncbi:Actin filament-associated protein 1-like 2 [Saguinus oedipus]|uniref:Actin filament-associated protein 1-like 2 n=1 Tax=Saguinus oedipus TaxID=9490 RepID=A0ABQ9UPN5_SAGOE|nr:Actin filament-associated protein 1-like 2 [Saguinus oedipus]
MEEDGQMLDFFMKHVGQPQKHRTDCPLPHEALTELVFLAEDGEAVSSSYESYDEEDSSKGKSGPYQWPSPEAGIELMRDARICAFLWRKKWLGQWAKQLCVIKDTRLLCYKSSKDHSPQLDVNLLGSSVVHKEKQVRKKEHKLKITPMNADVIVLGLQSKDQAEQWLRKVLTDISIFIAKSSSGERQWYIEKERLLHRQVCGLASWISMWVPRAVPLTAQIHRPFPWPLASLPKLSRPHSETPAPRASAGGFKDKNAFRRHRLSVSSLHRETLPPSQMSAEVDLAGNARSEKLPTFALWE